jgi:hypothetical protein
MLRKWLVVVVTLFALVVVSSWLSTTIRRRKREVSRVVAVVKARRWRDSTFRADNIDTLRTYSQAVCLQFHGKPLLTIGQQIAKLPTAFKYRRNFEFEEAGDPFAHEYVSFNTYYGAANGNTGPNGSLWLLTNNEGRIFGLHGSWVIASVLDKKEQLIASREIARWLPCIQRKLDFEHHKVLVLENEEFKEEFEMTPANDSTWGHLEYNVKLKPFLTHP